MASPKYIADPETGEAIPVEVPVHDQDPLQRRADEIHAADRAQDANELDMPRTPDELIASLSGPEPDPMDILRAVAGQAELPQLPAEDSARAIMARILAAPDIESVLRQGRAVGAEEILEVPLTIDGVRWSRSSYADGPNVFAIIDAIREDTHERVVVSCGSVNVMSQLWRVWIEQAWPIRARVVRSSKPSESGFYPLWLDSAGDR